MSQIKELRDRVRGGFVGAFIGERLGELKQKEEGREFNTPEMNGWRRTDMQTRIIMKHGLQPKAIEEINADRRKTFEGKLESPAATLASAVTLGLGIKLNGYATGLVKKHERPKIDLAKACEFVAALDTVSQDPGERNAPKFLLDRFYDAVFSKSTKLEMLEEARVTSSEVEIFLKDQPDDVFAKALHRLTDGRAYKDAVYSIDEFGSKQGIELGSATQVACQAMAICARCIDFKVGINEILTYGKFGMHTSLVCAVVGGYFGTHNGFSNIPREWLEAHLDHERAFELANEYFDAFIEKEQ